MRHCQKGQNNAKWGWGILLVFVLNSRKKYISFFILLGCLLFLVVPSLFAQMSAGVSALDASFPKGDNLTLKIAVMGTGDELYFWFGHIALVAEDNVTGQAKLYDWGVFSFDTDNFYSNFAFGRLIYCCMVSRADLNYAAYIQRNRDITLYTLDLSAEKKEEIVRFADNNVLPENRDYAYHHFKDNCATRIRDIIDMAVGGQFRAEFGNMPGRFTYRQHVRRHTWFNPFYDWILNFWMGQDIDKPTTVWEEMFLPSEIAARIKDFRYTAPGGAEKQLVSRTEVLYSASKRPAVLDTPRLQWPRELIASSLFSCLLLALYFSRKKIKGFRVIMGLVQALLGIFFGIAGSALFFMSFFTNHDYTYHNSNIFFVNPLLFAAVPLALIFAFTKNKKKRFVVTRLLRFLWTYVLLGGLLTMVIKLSPAFYQQNQTDVALVLPIAFCLAFIMLREGSLKNMENS